MSRFRSILSRVVALHVVTIGVISIVMPLALYWLLNEAANGLHRDALHSQAVTISGFLKPRANGVALDIPPEMEPLYAGSYGLYAYAVLDSEGHVLFSSRNDGSALFPPKEQRTGDWAMRRRTTGSVLFGVSVSRTGFSARRKIRMSIRSSASSSGKVIQATLGKNEATMSSMMTSRCDRSCATWIR